MTLVVDDEARIKLGLWDSKPNPADCVLLSPWVTTGSCCGWGYVTTICSKPGTGAVISILYRQAFGRSLGMRKSRQLSKAGGSTFIPIVHSHKNRVRVRNQQNAWICQILSCHFGLWAEELFGAETGSSHG